jgi:hypothetical protein
MEHFTMGCLSPGQVLDGLLEDLKRVIEVEETVEIEGEIELNIHLL